MYNRQSIFEIIWMLLQQDIVVSFWNPDLYVTWITLNQNGRAYYLKLNVIDRNNPNS